MEATPTNPKSTRRQARWSRFHITINTNQRYNADHPNLEADKVKFDEVIRRFLSHAEFGRFVKYNGVPGDWTPEYIREYSYAYAVERSPKNETLHAHIVVQIQHYTKVQLNDDAIRAFFAGEGYAPHYHREILKSGEDSERAINYAVKDIPEDRRVKEVLEEVPDIGKHGARRHTIIRGVRYYDQGEHDQPTYADPADETADNIQVLDLGSDPVIQAPPPPQPAAAPQPRSILKQSVRFAAPKPTRQQHGHKKARRKHSKPAPVESSSDDESSSSDSSDDELFIRTHEGGGVRIKSIGPYGLTYGLN